MFHFFKKTILPVPFLAMCCAATAHALPAENYIESFDFKVQGNLIAIEYRLKSLPAASNYYTVSLSGKIDGRVVYPTAVFGDIGRLDAANDTKRIFWDCLKDEPILNGQLSLKLDVQLFGKKNAHDDRMVLVRGGTFQMGSNDGESDEKPVHAVTVSDFYLSKFELTVAEFRKFVEDKNYQTDAETGDGSYIFVDGNWKKTAGINWRHDAEGKNALDYHPVIHVSWNDAVAYCEWISKKTGQKYRLPTEAEWEYAAGNGSRHTKYSWGNADPSGKKGGNIADKTAKAKYSDWKIFENYTDGYIFTAPVGSFDANDLGLHDMTGNVWEWCSDWYDKDYYKNSPSSNPKGADSGVYRVYRGGSWLNAPQNCRAADRYDNTPTYRFLNLGFRLARSF